MRENFQLALRAGNDNTFVAKEGISDLGRRKSYVKPTLRLEPRHWPRAFAQDFAEPTTKLAVEKFRIVLIKPSKYDADGYVIRFWKGVLPSNTLNVLHGLTEEVKHSRVFGDLKIAIVTFDETLPGVPLHLPHQESQ